MRRREFISLRTKLAAALCLLFKVPHEHAKAMTEDQVLSLAQWDHYPIPKLGEYGEFEDGVIDFAYDVDAHYNLVPRPILEHREKTAKIDIPQIAKGRRITKQQEEFRRRLLAKDAGEPRPRSNWPKRKLTSRNDLRRRP